MRHDETLEPPSSDLIEFSTLVWRELWVYTPQGRRARCFAGAGVSLVGLSVISHVLYGIYRGLGATLLGSPGPVPPMVWVASATCFVVGTALLGVTAVVKLRSMRVPRLTATDMNAKNRANGHPMPIHRGSRTD